MDRFASDPEKLNDTSQPDLTPSDAVEPSRKRMVQLAALADGSLRSSELRTELEADAGMRTLLAEQDQAVARVRSAAAAVHAPDALRARLQTLTPAPADARGPRRRSSTRGVAPRRGLFAGLASAATVIVLVIAFTLSGTSGAPTVAQAAALATRPSTLPPPRHLGPHPTLDATEAGLPFPYWDDAFHWHAIGARTDQLAGRSVTTVWYTRGGWRLGYAIVSGPVLKAPAGAQASVRNGVHLLVVSSDGTTVVTWDRDGHSCVLTAYGVPARTLEALASWHNGSIAG